MDAWEQPVDTADIDERLTNARLRLPAKLKIIVNPDVADVIRAERTESLPRGRPDHSGGDAEAGSAANGGGAPSWEAGGAARIRGCRLRVGADP
jgi:hypothetical protein